MGSSKIPQISSDETHKIESIDAANKFLSVMRNKRLTIKRKRELNMRIYALLSSSICRVENDIRSKQQERAKKWALLRMKAIEKMEEETMEAKMQKDKMWTEDLNGLNNFLNNLSQIKTIVVR